MSKIKKFEFPKWADKKFAKLAKRMPDNLIITSVEGDAEREVKVIVKSGDYCRAITFARDGEKCRSKTIKAKV